MTKSKLPLTLLILCMAVGSAMASTKAIMRSFNNPYYTTDGGITFKIYIQNNVPCKILGSGCIQNVGADGLQQLYATPSLSTPLQFE